MIGVYFLVFMMEEVEMRRRGKGGCLVYMLYYYLDKLFGFVRSFMQMLVIDFF